MAREEDLTKTKTFPGINNLVEEEIAAPGTLRDAVNVDLIGDPEVAVVPRLRTGRTLLLEDAGAHSFWCDGQTPFGLYINGEGTLKALFPDAETTDLVTGLSPGARMSCERINDRIYWSNAQACGLVTLGLDAMPWAVDGPGQTPACAPATAGGLAKGKYQVACTFRDATGRESGTGVAQVTDVPAGGGVDLFNIPQPADPVAVPTIRLYVSGADGDVLYHHFDLPAGTTEFLVGKKPKGPPLQTQLMVTMPPGHIVRALNGQQLVARGRELLFSPGLRYGMVDPVRGRIGFPKRLSMVEPVGDSAAGAGVYVASGERTYFITGANLNNTAEVSQKIVKSAGAVPGTSCRVDAVLLGFDLGEIPIPVWLATTGQYCAGLPGGQVVTFKLKDAVTDIGDSGATLFREVNGHRQLITTLSNARPVGLRVTDRVTVREIKHYEGAP